MGTTGEHEMKRQLEGLPESAPDYSALWARIEEEAASRRADWARADTDSNRVLVMSVLKEPNRTSKRRRVWSLLISSAVVLCLMLVPVTLLRHEAGQGNSGVEVGQKIGKADTLDGATLSLDAIAAEKADFSGESRISLFMSLLVPDRHRFEEVIFDRQQLTDLLTGEQFQLAQGNYEGLHSGGGLTRSYEISGLELPRGQRDYKFTATDLLLRATRDVPLPLSKPKASYNIPTGQFNTLTISSVERTGSRLIVQYSLSGSNQDRHSYSYYMDRHRLEWKVGDRSIRAGNSRTDDEGLYTDIFDLTGFSEQQIERGGLHYLYMDTIKKIAGDWNIRFTADFEQALQPSTRYALSPDTELESMAGITLRELALSPFQIEVHYDREHQPDILDPQGGLFNFQKVELEAGDELLNGQQLEEQDKGRNGGRFWFSSLHRNWRGQPLTLLLSEPLLVKRDLTQYWSPLSPPTAAKQSETITMEHKYELHYWYFREGSNLIVQTSVPPSISILYGTVLKVNGSLIYPDPEHSWYSGEYSRRTDRFKDVPEGAELEINPGSYGYIDKSKSLRIPLRP